MSHSHRESCSTESSKEAEADSPGEVTWPFLTALLMEDKLRGCNLARHLQPLSNQSCRMLETRSPGMTYTGWRSDITGESILLVFEEMRKER